MTTDSEAWVKPLPMLLWCPECHERHVDGGEFKAKPHHTHACQRCGFVWRPAIGPTVGVQFLPGFSDWENVLERQKRGDFGAPGPRCVRCGAEYAPAGHCSKRQEGCQGGRGEAPGHSRLDAMEALAAEVSALRTQIATVTRERDHAREEARADKAEANFAAALETAQESSATCGELLVQRNAALTDARHWEAKWLKEKMEHKASLRASGEVLMAKDAELAALRQRVEELESALSAMTLDRNGLKRNFGDNMP